MRLWIAEKPSVARAIANALGITSRDANCITCSNNNTVTWCFGHMLELESPDYYLSDDVPEKKNGNGKLWRMQDLPIVPAVWKHVVKKEAAAQLKMIKKLLSSADEVVNCGDPDREGQLLVVGSSYDKVLRSIFVAQLYSRCGVIYENQFAVVERLLCHFLSWQRFQLLFQFLNNVVDNFLRSSD